MAKRAKAREKDEDGHGVSAIRGNGFDTEAVQGFVDRIESLQTEIDDAMEAAKEECAPHREDIAAVKKEAHDAGLPRRELNLAIAKRRTLRRVDAAREKLSDEQKDNFDQIEKALGMFKETPLGGAALAKADARKNGGAAALV